MFKSSGAELRTNALLGPAALLRFSAAERLKFGGAGRDRTGDLLNANQALSQLSYSPQGKTALLRARLGKKLIEADWTQTRDKLINPHESNPY